jgi:deazaflavin-dependent oxidoreductase (nitroreductase family)
MEEKLSNSERKVFHLFNKIFMVPMYRLGFGPVMGNPITGYIMVLKTVGRRTGKVYYSPVNYAIHRGNVYCMAGWGKATDWFRNMINKQEIEAILPSGPFFGTFEEVNDLDERRVVLRKILKNAGFAGYFEGFNPYTVTDVELLGKTTDKPLLRIHISGIGNGPSDPGGLSWVWTALSIIGMIILLVWFILTR